MKEKIRQLFSQLLKLGSYKAGDVTLIYEGELGVGTEVFVESENGEIRPAPDGVYGDYTVVAGRIAEPEKIEEEAAAEEPVVDETAALKEENEALKAKIAELEAKIAELEGLNEELSKQQMSAAEQLKAVETTEKVDKTKNNFGKYFEN